MPGFSKSLSVKIKAPNVHDVFDFGVEMPNIFNKKVKKTPQKKLLEQAREKLADRVDSLWNRYHAGGGLPSISVEENLQNAVRNMGGDIIESDNTGEILNSLIAFLERKGYVVSKNLATTNPLSLQYVIAYSNQIENKQFVAGFIDDRFDKRIFYHNDDINKIFIELKKNLKQDIGDRHSIRKGFFIGRLVVDANGRERIDELYHWVNVKKYFGKKRPVIAPIEKVLNKIDDAMQKVLNEK